MAKKNTVKKIFPLLVLSDEENGSQRPYIAKIHVELAFQTLRLLGIGTEDTGELKRVIDEMYAELTKPVVIGD